ncbi:MAG: 6-bladed beta-propeller [Paramuribaculum sp.]|nr:6-bladed beta-propeller [Paramuribaculum sp.]
MTNKTISLLAAAALMLSASCTSEKGGLPVIDLAANVNAENTAKIDSILDVRLVLHPEATDSTLIGSLDLAGIVDDNYFIYSFDGNMMVFAKDGKCLCSFDRKGYGPGEYGSYASPMADRATKGWAAFSNTQPKVFTYTMSGEFTGCDTLQVRGIPTALGNGWVVGSNSFINDTISYYYYSDKFLITDSLKTGMLYKVFREYDGATVFGPNISSTGNLATVYWNDTIYDITDPAAGLRPLAAVNLGTLGMPWDFNPAQNRDKVDSYIDASVYSTATRYLVWMKYDHKLYAQFYDRATGSLLASISAPREKGQPYGVPFSFNGSTIYLTPAYYTTDDTFYFTASDATMSELTGKEDSNPALFAIKIK